jgi:hypothetical protein
MSAPRKPMTFDVNTPGNDLPPPSAAVPVSVPPAPRREREERQQVGARISAATYRKLKILAVTQDEPVQNLVEQAIVEFLERLPG